MMGLHSVFGWRFSTPPAVVMTYRATDASNAANHFLTRDAHILEGRQIGLSKLMMGLNGRRQFFQMSLQGGCLAFGGRKHVPIGTLEVVLGHHAGGWVVIVFH